MLAKKISAAAALVACFGCGGGTEVTRNDPSQGGALAVAGSGGPAAQVVDPAKGNASTILVMVQPPPAPAAPPAAAPSGPAPVLPPPPAGGFPGARPGLPPPAGAPTVPGGVPGAPPPPPPAAAPPPPIVGNVGEPVIPEIKGECPKLEAGSISFMGLTGQVEAGPKPSSPTAPMLLYWHGTGSTAGEYAFMAGAISQGVTSQGGIVVSFQNSTMKGDCGVSGTAIFCVGDFEAMDQYVACAVKNRNVDPHRIYTAGCSAGGLMATAMAMQRSQYIAAAAPNSGGLTFGGAFSSMHTPALMTIHGAPGSDVVGVDFSQTSATADMAWKKRGGFAIDCNTGGGHCGGGGLAGDAWKFFQAHPFGIDPEPWTAMLPAGFSSMCKLQ